MSSYTLQQAASLRNKVIGIFFIIIIVPFLLFAYYAHIKSVEGISNANASFSMDYMLQSKRNLDRYLNQLNEQINGIIGNTKFQQLMENSMTPTKDESSFISGMMLLLDQSKSQVDAFRVRVFPIDPNEHPMYINTLDEQKGFQTSNWFKAAQKTITPTWHLFMPAESTYFRPMLSKIKRFTGLHDQIPRGIVITDLTEDQLKRYLSPSQRMKGQRMFLMTRSGYVLYDTADNALAGKLIPSKPLIDSIAASTQKAETLTIDGEKQLVTYVKLDTEQWMLVSTTPLEQLTHPIQEMDKLLVFFLIIYLICCIGVIIYMTLYFTHPLHRLVRSMRKLESGEFQFMLPPSDRRDEIGWLYRGFNNMTGKIQQLLDQTTQAERTKKELEFQVLSHQINPHFLYNTLESIRWKAEYHNMPDISEMVSSLGNLLRLSLNQGKEITTVSREIEQVKAYVRIEQARLGNQVRFLISIDEEVLHAPFLRLLLQPLVENAIHHGIRSNPEKGKIMLTGRREGTDIVIELSDNGQGIPEAVLQELTHPEEKAAPVAKRRGVGLRNVNDRLKLYFGEAYTLQIEARAGSGTRIVLRHPIMEPEEEQA
ncbi:sensor histidine kinase [Paenibacillus sp. CF384]|uniref:cache domain-containing sensor histidine kinase n=1 Tax=Paenibacillus sp. CF384 TaxID=1884382 RepID=UPI00089879CB|nr:sensor histidine kinase [Paenibacillus sp. CF384]SDW43508.1 Histidine kinase-, DNA gyrase B-, and HSP90-like ATPase [Paenibacillus sp. CF384]